LHLWPLVALALSVCGEIVLCVYMAGTACYLFYGKCTSPALLAAQMQATVGKCMA